MSRSGVGGGGTGDKDAQAKFMPAADGGVVISRSKDGDIILSKDGAEPVDDEAEAGKEEGVGAAGGAAAAAGSGIIDHGAVAGGIAGGGGGASAEAAAEEAAEFRAAAAAEDAVAEAKRYTQFTCFTSTSKKALGLFASRVHKYKY